jgi:hypothetical protein
MSNSAFDVFLDKCVDEFYEDVEEPLDLCLDDEPLVEPNIDYDNYDGWDDMQ